MFKYNSFYIWKALKELDILQVCLLRYGESHIIMTVWLDHFEGVIALFNLELFIKKFVHVPSVPPLF
jgi:hypothetical protein